MGQCSPILLTPRPILTTCGVVAPLGAPPALQTCGHSSVATLPPPTLCQALSVAQGIPAGPYPYEDLVLEVVWHFGPVLFLSGLSLESILVPFPVIQGCLRFNLHRSWSCCLLHGYCGTRVCIFGPIPTVYGMYRHPPRNQKPGPEIGSTLHVRLGHCCSVCLARHTATLPFWTSRDAHGTPTGLIRANTKTKTQGVGGQYLAKRHPACRPS